MWYQLRLLLFTPARSLSRRTLFWFTLSLTFSAVYGILALQQAFNGEYVVQDDARQHVFWMQRFLDPTLFPNDLITDYFQSVAPAGYTALYKLMNAVGLEPALFSKLLPVVLGVITTAYCFGIAFELLPVPITGFIASLLYGQNMWLRDDLASATPRAFIYPIFLAFLYYFLRRSLFPCLTALALQAFFYPTYVFVSIGLLLLQLVRWQNGRLELSRDRQDYQFCFSGLAVGFIALLPFALTSSNYGPTIKAVEAKTLPEFLPGGRSSFFESDPVSYWFTGKRSGLLPRSLFTPVTVLVGFLLPIFIKFPARFPLTKHVRSINLLPQLLVVSTGLFLVAHAVLFKLHLPSRYTGLCFRLVMILAAGIAFTVILAAVCHWAEQQLLIASGKRVVSLTAWGTTMVISIALLFYPAFVRHFPITGYRSGQVPSLYQFFAQQPKDSLIASLAEEASNLPTFAKRSILVGSEYAIPYQVGYYRQFRQRTMDLIQAQYSPNPAIVQQFIQKYGVDFWLLDDRAFDPNYVATNGWLKQYQPATAEAITGLNNGKVPALQKITQQCKAFETANLTVLPATCIRESL